ncbi:hypothetical protein L1887_14429 [Cichorium endivia]|nr:hypothetical protein L1887_14429 [Cichorium endivia]
MAKPRRSNSVPEGHLPVYVGEEMERFVVNAELLNHPIFINLLNKSAQEYDYKQKGVLRIPATSSSLNVSSKLYEPTKERLTSSKTNSPTNSCNSLWIVVRFSFCLIACQANSEVRSSFDAD